MRAVAAAAAAAVGASLLAVSTSSPVGAAASVTTETRIAGADRYATANAVATAVDALDTAGNENNVVIASGENFPDGLAASALAGALDAPMLLTTADALPTSVLTTLTTITGGGGVTKNVVLIGGTSVISADIATQLTALNYQVTRISGADRYETANEVAEAVFTNNSGTIGTFGAAAYKTAFLANGNNFPDALAASSFAYKGKHPLFLSDGATLTDGTIASMKAVGVQQIIILGGETAVSAEVATAAAGVTGVISVVRVSGDTRYDTATALATTLAGADAGYKTNAMLVSGTNFPDALAAAQLAGQTGTTYAIIPVTDPLPAAVSAWATANQATLAKVRAIGGTSAIPDTVVSAVDEAGTIAPLSATIAATDGAGTFSVTFSGNVSGATTKTNYRVTAATGASKEVASATYDSTTLKATVTVTGGIAAGDTIQVLGASITSATNTSLYVSAASFTVVADAAAPTVTITAYPTTTGAVASDPSAVDRVWLTFSSNASMSATNNAVAVLKGALYYKGPAISDTQTGSVFTCDQTGLTGTTTWRCDTAVAMAAGGTVYMLAGAFKSTASTPVNSAAVVATVTADTTKPAISSATFTQSSTATGAVAASAGLAGGYVTVSAKAGTTAGGKAGNLVKVATVSLSAGSSPTCEFSSTTNTVTVSAYGATTSALAIANTCNTTATFSALFTATVHGAGTADVTSWATAAATNLSGGKDLVTVTLTFSESVPDFAYGDITFSDVVGGTATAIGYAASTAAAQALEKLAGTVTVTATTNGTVTAGFSKVNPSASVTDRAGNAADATVKTTLVAG